jgi:hypothetical protein
MATDDELRKLRGAEDYDREAVESNIRAAFSALGVLVRQHGGTDGQTRQECREALGLIAALVAEVARLDKQLLAARRVTLADADGHPDDAALVRQLEAAAREVDSSLLECAALRLKRALTDQQWTQRWYAERWERLRTLIRDDASHIEDDACAIMANGAASPTEPPSYGRIVAGLESDNARLRALAEAALRLCGFCLGGGSIWVDEDGKRRCETPESRPPYQPVPCPACGPIRRGLDAGEGCDA